MTTLKDDIALFQRQAADLMTTIQRICHTVQVEAPLAQAKRIAIIQRAVIEEFELPENVMSSRVRTNRFAQGRHVALYLCRELTGYNTTAIANAFRPDMERSLISHAVTVIQNTMRTDALFKTRVETLRAKCKAAIDAYNMPLFSIAQDAS